jgi:NAD(P)-dependent dehydrogenase (short-subunit alcohol dehydrogenase family)/acyl carrier protein
VDPGQRADYAALLKALADGGQTPHFVAHLWGVTRQEAGSSLDRLEEAQARGFYSLLFLAQALARLEDKQALHIGVVTNHMQEVAAGELTCPEKATVLGPCKVIPQEMTHIACRSFDVEVPEPGSRQAATLALRIVAELFTGQTEPVVAYRGPHRWVQSAEPTPLPPPNGSSPLRERGVYLVTGGLGGIGLVFARHLAEHWKARLVLTGRSSVPLDAAQIRGLESQGAEVLYLAADVARRGDMERVVTRARERFGPIQGVIHSAGVAGGGIIPLKEPEVAARVMAPKVVGTLLLDEVLKDEPLDFMLLCSSVAAIVGGIGQIDYCGANAFLDAYAHASRSRRAFPVLSVNWDAWKEVGMAVNTPVPGALQAARDFSLKVGIAPAEGVDALGRILAAGLPQVAVFTMDARPRLLQSQLWRKVAKPRLEATDESASRVEVGSEKTGGDLESVVIESWERILGCKEIGPNDNFFELGGDSLTALQVVALLKARLGREIPIVTFYESPTVGLLARALKEDGQQKPVVLDEVEQRAGARRELLQRRRRQRDAEPALESSR